LKGDEICQNEPVAGVLRQAMICWELVQTKKVVLKRKCLEICGKDALHNIFSMNDPLVLLTPCWQFARNTYQIPTYQPEEKYESASDLFMSIMVGKYI
jgi:hypothetical protein